MSGIVAQLRCECTSNVGNRKIDALLKSFLFGELDAEMKEMLDEVFVLSSEDREKFIALVLTKLVEMYLFASRTNPEKKAEILDKVLKLSERGVVCAEFYKLTGLDELQ